jgi:Tfp pilus assembly PilM family ATPase
MKVILGVEIGEEYFKIAAGKRKGIQSKVVDCAGQSILSLSDNDISSAITNIVKKGRYKSKAVEVSLPRNFVTVRNLHLPSQNEQEIGSMIELHIDRIVPYKKEDVVFSYSLVGRDEISYTRVILAIVHSEIIRRQVKILDEVGFLIDRINLSSYGIWQWVCSNHRSEINQSDIYLILDVDTTFTDFIIFDWNNLLFTRSMAIPARELDNELGMKRLLGEVRQSLLIFQNEEMNKKPARIFLGGAVNPNFKEKVESELYCPVTIVADPLSAPALKGKKEPLPRDTSFSSVTNLVLEEKPQKLSFVLPEIQIRKSFKEKIKDLVILGTLVIYTLSIICMIFLSQIYNQESYLRKLDARYLEVGKEVNVLVRQLDKINFVQKYLNERRVPLFIMNQLQKVMLDTISFNFIGINEDGSVTLRGQSRQLSDVFKLTTDLDQLEFFKNAETKYTRQRKLKDGTLTDFEVSFVFDYTVEEKIE